MTDTRAGLGVCEIGMLWSWTGLFLLTESIQGHRSCRWHLRDSADRLGLELKLSKSTVGASHALSEPSFARVCVSLSLWGKH